MDGAVAERIRSGVCRAEGFRWMASMLATAPQGGRWRVLQHKGVLVAVPETHDGLAYAAEWTVGAFEVARGSDWLPALPMPMGELLLGAPAGWALVIDDPGSIGCLLQLVATTRPAARLAALKSVVAGASSVAPSGHPDVGAVGYALALLLLGWPSETSPC